jgi:DNA-binding NarL/FixJ family response regulator
VEAISAMTELAAADVALMDWGVLVPDAREKIMKLKAQNPGLKVLVLSVHALNRGAALNGGADAFVCKCDPPEELLAELLTLRLA